MRDTPVLRPTSTSPVPANNNRKKHNMRVIALYVLLLSWASAIYYTLAHDHSVVAFAIFYVGFVCLVSLFLRGATR